MERITWQEDKGATRSGWTGIVGNRALFTITWSISRKSTWVLRTSLPFGLVDTKSLAKDPEALRAYAERVLDVFVRSLGAAWTEQ